MSINGSRYVKAIRQTTAPTRLLICVAESEPLSARGRSDVTYECGRAVWCLYSRRSESQWFCRETPIRLTLNHWWNYVNSLLSDRQRLYIVAPIASDFLTLTRFWERVNNGVYRVADPCRAGLDAGGGKRQPSRPRRVRLVLKGKPDIIGFWSDRGTAVMVSMRNYLDTDIRDIARATNYQLPVVADSEGRNRPESPDPADQCVILSRFMRQFIGRWLTEGNGPWRETISQLAVSMWRTRFYTQRICRHADDDASQLESDALHGGRASIWCLADLGWRLSLEGDAETPPQRSHYPAIHSVVYRYDVRSMYPSLLRDREFPVRLLSVHDATDIETLAAMIRHYAVIARVTIETDEAEYPVRTDRRVYYPVGRFTTTLAGPELEYAISRRHLRTVHAYARYERGTPFRQFAGQLIANRDLCRANSDALGSLYWKALANSFGGKFAQRADRWEPRPQVPAVRQWGEWYRRDVDTPTPSRWRGIAGVSHELVKGRPGACLLGAVFCYLTSYGRQMMLQYRRAVGLSAVVAQDTDGIWVLEAGHAVAQRHGLLSHDTAGTLRMVSEHRYARFFSPCHYYVDGTWTLAGYADGFDVIGDNRIVERISVNPARSKCRRTPRTIATIRREKTLERIDWFGSVDKDGWMIPGYITSVDDLIRHENRSERRGQSGCKRPV